MRTEHPRVLPWLAGLLLALGCQSDRLLEPVDSPPKHPGLEAIAVRVEVDVVQGTVRVLEPAARDGAGPSLAILGFNEVGVAAGNVVRSAPVNGKVTVTFDAALTNRLTSHTLVPSTFPSTTGGTGLVLFPFQVTQVVGGTASQVAASADWNGDGSAGSGAPRNFFNDVGCPSTNALADCFRWEQYPAPLGPGETTPGQKVGFMLPKAITSFQVLMVLAADISNDLPAVASLAVTPPSYTFADGFPAGFSAVAYDALGHPLPWVTILWGTEDIMKAPFQSGGSLVGAITGSGVIVHARQVGPTFITASSGGVTTTVPLDIQVNTVALVQLMTPDSSLTTGDQVQGDARVKDHSGQIIPGLLPTWSTTDPNVITVDQNGLITAVGAGTANVIATAGNQSAAVTIVVDRLIAGDLAGTMRDLEGQPVKGATLTATGFTAVFTTTTGDDGSYLFHNLPITGTGVYLLQWSPAGCTAGAQNRIVLQVGGVITVDIDTDCPASVSGVVKMTTGTLPAGVTVELRPDAGGANRVGAVQPDGSYSMTGVPSGGYFIFVNGLPANCTAFGAQSISLTQQAHYVQDWSVDCQSTSGLTGQVRDVEGGPIAGATIDVQSQTTGQMFSTTADAAGGYSLLLPPDEYGITVSKPGPCVSFGTFNFTVPAGQPRVVNPVMDCPWHVLGRVVALGGPLPPSLVVFVPSPGPLEHADVLSDGTYEIVELPYPNGASGALSVEIFGLPSRCVVTGGPFNITVTQQMQLQVPDFTLDCRPPSIQVLVTDGGTNPDPQPLIDMLVTLIGPSGSSNSQTGRTGQDGILFQNAEAGGNFISVAQGTHGCSGNTAGVTAQPGTQYNVVVPVSCTTTGALQGTLRSALGNPISNATIIVGTYSLTTDQNGHWGVAGLPPGPLFVNVLPPLPGGCTGPGAVQAAVITMFTITVDLTATCPGF